MSAKDSPHKSVRDWFYSPGASPETIRLARQRRRECEARAQKCHGVRRDIVVIDDRQSREGGQ